MIVIEGLTMPKGEDDGILIALYDGKAHQIGTKKTFTASEVPAHGRLIDADALNYTMLYKENWIAGTGTEAPAVWKKDIDAAPTVIPAEPPKEEE